MVEGGFGIVKALSVRTWLWAAENYPVAPVPRTGDNPLWRELFVCALIALAIFVPLCLFYTLFRLCWAAIRYLERRAKP
jgi:heme/copper-type cytochrome/quinol oxidase subunit 2